ncbi:MAG: TetR/AcrR family transcriptional regulator [Variovorax sp.]
MAIVHRAGFRRRRQHLAPGRAFELRLALGLHVQFGIQEGQPGLRDLRLGRGSHEVLQQRQRLAQSALLAPQAEHLHAICTHCQMLGDAPTEFQRLGGPGFGVGEAAFGDGRCFSASAMPQASGRRGFLRRRHCRNHLNLRNIKLKFCSITWAVMATRRYTPRKRLAQVSERRQRVTAATAQLHAAKGPLATSYADIAQRAGVSVPTVYSYFPTQAALMTACTGHVADRAPPLPVGAILAAPDLHAAATTLVAAMDALHAYVEPWAAWRQELVIPFLEELRTTRREQLTALLVRLLSQHCKGSQAVHAATWESLLSFDLWQRLVQQHALPRARVRALLIDLLLAAHGPRASDTQSPGPRRRP